MDFQTFFPVDPLIDDQNYATAPNFVTRFLLLDIEKQPRQTQEQYISSTGIYRKTILDPRFI